MSRRTRSRSKGWFCRRRRKFAVLKAVKDDQETLQMTGRVLNGPGDAHAHLLGQLHVRLCSHVDLVELGIEFRDLIGGSDPC